MMTLNAMADDAVDGNTAIYGTWWRGGPNAPELVAKRPFIKGVFGAFYWKDIETAPGVFDFTSMDKRLTEYANAGLYIQFMVWVGPHSPRWLYENGVPEVRTTPTINPWGRPHGWTYPYYLDEDYVRYFMRLIRRVSDHIDELPPRVRERIVCIQTAEGTTGDEGPYKGQPLDKRYRMSEDDWNAMKFDAWRLFDELYSVKEPKIHLLINSGNKGQYHDWIMGNMPDTWRKAGNPGHGYQLNDEMKMVEFLDPLINRRNRNDVYIRCRSEMDETHKGWFKEAPVWNQYWLNLWGLTFGIDILQHNTKAFDDPAHDEGFAFYSKYGGRKDPSKAPGAWIALRDGLDAADKQRFPESGFGPGRRTSVKGQKEIGMARCVKIAEAFADHGARQGDPDKAMYVVMKNRDASAMNDVGWDIWRGAYGMHLRQIDANETTVGWWRVGSKDQPYGRFARGFEAASGKTTMLFDLDDAFFSKGASRKVNVRVVYFDQGRGSWRLDADGLVKPALEVTNEGSDRWKETTITIDGAAFNNGGPRGADLWLSHGSGDDCLFHMIELTRAD